MEFPGMDNTNTVCAVSQPAVSGMCSHQWLVMQAVYTPAQLPAGGGYDALGYESLCVCVQPRELATML